MAFNDPFSAFKNTANDPFAAFVEMGSAFDSFPNPYEIKDRRGRTAISAEFQLQQMEDLLLRGGVKKSLIPQILRNAGNNVKEIVQGVGKLAALGIHGAKQAARLPLNIATGDSEDLTEIMGTFKSAAGAVPEMLQSEWQRIKSVYGPIFTDFDFNPLKEYAYERPVDFGLDVLSVASVVGAAPKAGASSIIRGLGVKAAKQGLEPGLLARAAFSANEKELRFLTAVVSEELGPDALMDFQKATHLNMVGRNIQTLGGTWAWKSIGTFGPLERMLTYYRDTSEAVGRTALITRHTTQLMSDNVDIVNRGLSLYRELDEVAQQRVLNHGQRLFPEPLTETEALAAQGFRMVGETFRPDMVERFRLGGVGAENANKILDQRVMADAITGEARILTSDPELRAMLSGTEKAVWGRLRSLENADDLIKSKTTKVETLKKLQQEAEQWADFLGDEDIITKNLAQQERLLMEVGIIEQAEARLAARELHYIPGKASNVSLTDLGPDAIEEFAKEGVSADILMQRSTANLSRKKDIVTDPLTVEDNFVKYAESIAKMYGGLQILDEVKAVSTAIPESAVEDLLRDVSIAKETGKNLDFEVIRLPSTGEVLTVPKGAARIYKDAIGRRVVDETVEPATKFLDFTKNEFTKVVLLFNPGWLTYNIFGGAALYTMSGGSPTAFAKALGMRTASGLEKIFKDSNKSLPAFVQKAVSKLAEEWREMVPRSIVQGFSGERMREIRAIENMTPTQEKWYDWGSKVAALKERRVGEVLTSTYSKGTSALAELPARGIKKALRMETKPLGSEYTLASLNETIEEVFRAATWMSTGKRQLAKQSFLNGGPTLMALGSTEMKKGFAQLAQELDPRVIKTRGALNLSPVAKNTMDLTNRFMNDYYRLGPIERKMFRRLFPFYSWMKFTNRLAAQLPFHHPMRMSIAAHTANAINDAKGVDETLPEWLQDYVEVGENGDGTTTFQSGRGGNPFTGVVWSGEIKEALTGLNPVLLVPIQWGIGFDMFRGESNRIAPERASRQGLVKIFGGRRAYELGPEGLEVVTPRPSLPLAMARGGLLPLPFFRQAEKVLRGGPHDDVGSLSELAVELSRIATGGPRIYPGAWIDKATKLPFEGGEASTALLRGVGLSTQRFDVEALRQRETEDRLSAVKRMLTEIGAGGR